MNIINLVMMNPGETIPKIDLFNLIINSKDQNSTAWLGDKYKINNTPQQGINWIGQLPEIFAVIIKKYTDKYSDDEIIEEGLIRYAFKENLGKINYDEKANLALIKQKDYGYPILFFDEKSDFFVYYGKFAVDSIFDKYVLLKPYNKRSLVIYPGKNSSEKSINLQEHIFYEKNIGYKKFIEKNQSHVCEICDLDFAKLYGFQFNDVHFKKESIDDINDAENDFSFLCSNCHQAVHLLMRSGKVEFTEIKTIIQERVKNYHRHDA